MSGSPPKAYRKLSLGDSAPLTLTPSVCALKIKQSCCQGRGYVIKDEGGAYLHVEKCKCVQECPACLGLLSQSKDQVAYPCRRPPPLRVIKCLNAARIPVRYVDANFRSFSNNTGNCRDIVTRVMQWEQKFQDTHSPGLLLTGPVGVGKTFLLACLCKNLAARGMSVRFVDFFQLLFEIKSAYSDHRSDQSILGPLLNVDVLVIDEMGKGRNTEFELTILDQLVMGRYNQRKTIVASTNYVLSKQSRHHLYHQRELDRGGEVGLGFGDGSSSSLEQRVGTRIYSRLLETSEILEMQGGDFRQRRRS